MRIRGSQPAHGEDSTVRVGHVSEGYFETLGIQLLRGRLLSDQDREGTRLLAADKLMSEQPRYEAIRDGVLNHMAHHRGQLTVYLRLNEEKVPAIYCPSADEGKG